MKRILKKVIGNVILTFEEFCTVLAEIEACLNSRPLTPLMSNDDGIEVLTPEQFLIGRPLMTLPQQTQTKKLSLLKHCELCQTLVVQFWTKWSAEYFISLNRFHKQEYKCQ
uniref:DUF5641 domain-containing protein n=1 Tax=Amphimedon queenslandica TaxID=400682 RepID=A0A1X7VUU0_AMPQE